MQKHDYRIDLVKLIATAMVVNLHVVGNTGGYIQQCLYLLGVYGIPLFFMVNGFLLYDKEYTVEYLKVKLFHYGRFLILWCFLIGVLVSIKDHRFISGLRVLTNVFVGSGWLFHLWFIVTLIIIHILYCAISFYMRFRNTSVDKIVRWWLSVFFIFVMNGIFMFDVFYLMPSHSLVAIVPIPYRLIRYIGYFVLGLYFRKLSYKEPTFKMKNWVLCLVVMASYFALCISRLFVEMSDVWSTNTFYPCIFCTIGTVAIFLLCMNQKAGNLKRFWKVVKYVAPTSVGIWVLHPFAQTIIKRLFEFMDIELTLFMRVLLVVIIFVGCMIISKVALKIKGVKMLFII